jgi:hypothetical protein
MRSKQRRVPGLRRYAAVAALALAAATAGTVSAAADVVQVIGPHQTFTGQVNGVTVNAVIKVLCAGPATPGQTGHPLSGQTVSASLLLPPTPVTAGYTGDAANRIRVDFGTPVSVAPVTELSAYGVPAAIPTTLLLPCSGAGTVAFVPIPTSPTARSSVIKVTYLNIGV